MNYLTQWNSGQNILSNQNVQNAAGMASSPALQALVNPTVSSAVSGRELKKYGNDTSAHNQFLLDWLKGYGGSGIGNSGGLGSILQTLLSVDPQIAGMRRTNDYEDWKMKQYMNQVEEGNRFVGGDVFNRRFGGAAGAGLSAATGGPWFSAADKADKYTFSNAMDMGLAYGNQANSLKNPKTVKQVDNTQSKGNSVYGEVGNPYNYINLMNQGYNMSAYKPKTTKKKTNTGLMNFA